MATQEAKCPIPTRQSLLARLKDWNDQAGWREFFDTYWKLIYSAASRAGLSDAEAQDVVQETIICVMKSMPAFQYDRTRGTFKGWLLRLTGWRIADQLRKRQWAVDESAAADAESMDFNSNIADDAEFEGYWNDEWELNILDAAVQRVKQKVDSQHFQIFDLLVFKQWTVPNVAKLLGVGRGYIYLVRHRVGKMIKEEVAYLRDKFE